MSNTKLDFPDPEIPVTTTNLLCGMANDTSFRLCVRAPRMVMCLGVVAMGEVLAPKVERMPISLLLLNHRLRK